MKKLLTLMLIAVSCIASAEPEISAEQLLSSGDPAKTPLGYLRCSALMHRLGIAAIKSNPEEGAGYIAIGVRYMKLYKNAMDLRTEDKKNEAQALTIALVKMYGQLAAENAKKSNAELERSMFVKDMNFCKKWSDDL
jgi:hypothetical protein